MLLVMIVCAVGAILLFTSGALDDLRDVWAHPEHKSADDAFHQSKPKDEIRRR